MRKLIFILLISSGLSAQTTLTLGRIDTIWGAGSVPRGVNNTNTWYTLYNKSATSSWLLTGNSGTTPGTNFLGTTDASLVFKAGGYYCGFIDIIHDNTFYGLYAGNLSSTGTYNSSFGWQALNSVTSGTKNTSIGYYSLYNTTTGSHNLALGQSSGRNNITGWDNIFIGDSSGYMWKGSGKLYIGQDGDSSITATMLGSKKVCLYGNVGVGTAAPGYTLDVNGTIRTNNVMYCESEKIGVASSFTGDLEFLNSSNTNAVDIITGVTSASYTLILPPVTGATGTVLGISGTTGGNQTLAWLSAGGATGPTGATGPSGGPTGPTGATGATGSGGGGNVTGSSPSTGTSLVYFPAFSQHNLTRLSYVGGVIELDTTTKIVAITGTELNAQNQAINMTDNSGSDGGGFYYDNNSNTGMGDVTNNDDDTWVGAFDKYGSGGGGLVNISSYNGVLIAPSLNFYSPTNTNYQLEVSGTCKISGNVTLSLPTYANDAAAGVGGLTTGQLYQQTTTHYVLIKQ